VNSGIILPHLGWLRAPSRQCRLEKTVAWAATPNRLVDAPKVCVPNRARAQRCFGQSERPLNRRDCALYRILNLFKGARLDLPDALARDAEFGGGESGSVPGYGYTSSRTLPGA